MNEGANTVVVVDITANKEYKVELTKQRVHTKNIGDKRMKINPWELCNN